MYSNAAEETKMLCGKTGHTLSIYANNLEDQSKNEI